MKKIIIIIFCIIFSSCKVDNDEQKLIYNQLVHYRDELKMNTSAIEQNIVFHTEEDKIYKNAIENSNKILAQYEKSFEKLKFKERVKMVKLRNTFNNEHKLFLNFDTSDYDNNVSDTIFNLLMEIDFYRLKISYQSRHLIRHGCK